MITYNERRFILLYLSTFAVFAVIAPYLSIMVRDLGYSPLWVGILLTVYEGAGIAGPFIFGYCADKTGSYKYPLLVSCGLPALAAIPLVLWVHPAFNAILLALMAIGIKSNLSLVDAITTINIEKRENYGKIRVWGSVCFIFVTLFLQWTRFMKPVSAVNISRWVTVFSLVSIVPILLLNENIFKFSSEKRTVQPDGKAADDSVTPVVNPFYVLGGFGIIFLSRLAMAAIYSYFPLYIIEEIKWNAVGILYALSSLSELPFMFLSARLIRRFGPIHLLAVSAAGICLRLLILSLFPFKPFIVAAQLLHSLCFGIYYPAAIYFTASVFSDKNRGKGMSVFLALGSGLPSLIGILVGGAVIEAIGFRFLFFLYACVAGLAVVIYAFLRKRQSF
ncbi:MAG: MFS transporter [Treponema sp.]|jgi:PPP family 3-phenylpropionic acid transporter|nr:MFS transporter [Treponema sp.]